MNNSYTDTVCVIHPDAVRFKVTLWLCKENYSSEAFCIHCVLCRVLYGFLKVTF